MAARTRFEFEQYTLEVDAEATKHAYESIPVVSTSCGCQGCANYLLATAQFPPEVQSFFERFGVDVTRPSEIYEVYDAAKNTCCYGGFYHVVGAILSQKEELFTKADKKLHILKPSMVIGLADKFSVWFESECELLPEDFPDPHFQISIDAKLPYLLDQPYDATTYSSKDNSFFHRLQSFFAGVIMKKATE